MVPNFGVMAFAQHNPELSEFLDEPEVSSTFLSYNCPNTSGRMKKTYVNYSNRLE